jgi:hypothetical protein
MEYSKMNYADARPDIKTGDVIAFGHEDWGSIYDLEIQIVRAATRSEYAHVGMAWCTSGRVFILEAVVPAVRIFPLSSMAPFYHIPMDIKLSDDALEYALSVVGERYSKAEAIRAFFGLENDDKLWECAEYVKEILKENGTVLKCKATPAGVVRELLEMGKEIRMVTEW